MSWNFQGRTIDFKIDELGLAHIIVASAIESASIVSHTNPTTGTTGKFSTKGLRVIYSHPEVEIDVKDEYAMEILSYVVNTVQEGIVYDEDFSIFHEDRVYSFFLKLDRFGNEVLFLKTDRRCATASSNK